jgi:hypothetical protein
MNWLRKKVIAWVREDWDEARRFDPRNRMSAVEVSEDTLDDPIRFELVGVVGGHLLKVRHPYNSKNDRSDSTTYIINKGEDIGEKVAKVINLELIK